MNHPACRFGAALFLTVLLPSCATEIDEVDGEHDAFVSDGKTDTGGIAEGSDSALGVLAVANELSRAELRDDAGLASVAVSNIVAFRNGDDEVAGTSDDARFTTLAQLDAVPFIGPVAFRKLLAYAEDNGFTDEPGGGGGPGPTTDPFDPASCAGAPMSHASALARRGTTLGAYQLAIREKICADSGNGACSTWKPIGVETLSWGGKASGTLSINTTANNGSLRLWLINQRNPGFGVDGTSCTGLGAPTTTCSTYQLKRADSSNFFFPPLIEGHGSLFFPEVTVKLNGVLTDSCARLTTRVDALPLHGTTEVVREAVVLVRF